MSTQSYSHFAQGFPQVLRLTPPSCSPLFHTFIHSPLSRKPPWRTAPPSVNIILLPCKKGDRHRPVSSDCRQPPLEKSLAEFRRPQTPEGKEAPSFPATCASEMTPLMTDRATFLQESSPVRHASLCRKRPKAFFDKLTLWGAVSDGNRAPQRFLVWSQLFSNARISRVKSAAASARPALPLGSNVPPTLPCIRPPV